MAGCMGLGSVFQRRRKRNGSSSRRWAVKNKQPQRTSVTPTSPDPNIKKVDIIEETIVQDYKQSSAISIEALFFVVGSVMQKCRNTVSSTCSGFLNAFLFWRGYAERVESLHRKVEELQMEIVQLHSTLKLSREAKTSGSTFKIPDGVHCFITPPPVSLPAPPPPPPPPPLPPPPPISSTFTIPKVAIIPNKSTKPPSLKKQDVPVAVTLRDLQAVRLRKVTVPYKTQVSPDKRRSPLVTLADLQKVSLRRSQSDLSMKFRSSTGRTPTKSLRNLGVHLRKVRMSRSPGGTPLNNKENEVKDSSLELSITKALGHRRLSAISKRLSPLKSI